MTHPQHIHTEHHKRSREEIAKAEIGHTDSTPGVNRFLVLFFALLIAAVPIARNLVEIRDIRAGGQPGRTVPQSWDAWFLLCPTRQEVSAIARPGSWGGLFEACKAMNNRMLRDITVYERELKDRDGLIQWLIPRMQAVITGRLRGGNEDAYCGRNGWLFYRRDVDSLTGRGFLEPDVLKQRAAGGSELKAPPQPDPIKAIVHFRDQLAARGIALLVVPAPVKPSIYPECYSRRYEGKSAVVQNPSFEPFKSRLAQAGVAVFDPAPLLAEARALKPDRPLYLKTDTHWTPSAMELTAARLAEVARRTVTLRPPEPGRFATAEKTVEALGDVALMLKLPARQGVFASERVTVRQVLEGNRFWGPATDAEVLFLGDSFANIYSLEPMGWGEAAGFAEHLSLALGLPVDTICRNDAGSYATREMLARELQRGHDRLARKKLVIWEFASRELSCGDWKMLTMELGQPGVTGFFAPSPGRIVALRGTVRAVSPAPQPGSVPYKDHILMIHVVESESPEDPSAAGKEAVVFAWSMRDNQALPAARLRPGDAVRLRVQPWSEVASKYDKINRSELDDERTVLADPAWAVDAEGAERGEAAAVVPVPPEPDRAVAQPAAGQAARLSGGQQIEGADLGAAAVFWELCRKKAADGDSMAMAGDDGWLFLRAELRHVGVGAFWGKDAAKVSKATSPDKADPLPAIVDFNNQLKALGIQLILAPVPCKALVYPEMLAGGAPGRLDRLHQEFFQQLEEKGVTVLDLADTFWKEKTKSGAPLLYCKTDSHWSPYACEVTARRIRDVLGSPAWLKGKPEAFRTQPQTRAISGDLADGKVPEELPVRLVEAPGSTLEDKTSPIVLLGDSHTLVFHAGAELHGTGAGLADQLAVELGLAVDVVGVRGSGATFARVNLVRRARADPAYLAGKKAIIWCFAAREFTESSGWSSIPLAR